MPVTFITKEMSRSFFCLSCWAYNSRIYKYKDEINKLLVLKQRKHNIEQNNSSEREFVSLLTTGVASFEPSLPAWSSPSGLDFVLVPGSFNST